MADFKEGDFIYFENKDDNGETVFEICHCLKIDSEYEVVHAALYEGLPVKPAALDIEDLVPFLAHAPIDINGFTNPVVFANRPVTAKDLEAYYTYLKDADFVAYLEETGQNVDELAKKADELYQKGCDLYEKESYEQAAKIFAEAVDTFPIFFEAADNAGFSYIELEDYEEAIYFFEHSIQVHHNTFLTDSCIAECHAALGNKEAAREWFLQAKGLEDATAEDVAYVDEALAELQKN